MRITHQAVDVVQLRPGARRALLVAATVLAAACSDGTGPGRSPGFGLAFRVDNPALARTSGGSAALTAGTVPEVTVTAAGLRIARDTDVIVVTKAQLVVRDVKLRRSGESCTDDDEADDSNLLAGGSSSDGDRDGNHDGRKDDDDLDECPPLKLGPFLVTLPVTGAEASMRGRLTGSHSFSWPT